MVLDLETFGTAIDSAVVSIGAASLGGSRYSRVIGNPSGAVDAGAIRWWLQQRVEVRDAVLFGSAEREVLEDFARWMDDQHAIADGRGAKFRVWGSEDFDTAILASAYRRNGMSVPWHYQQARGLRTILDIAGVDEDAIPWEGIEHIAVDCAVHAAAALRVALTVLAPADMEAAAKEHTG